MIPLHRFGTGGGGGGGNSGDSGGTSRVDVGVNDVDGVSGACTIN